VHAVAVLPLEARQGPDDIRECPDLVAGDREYARLGLSGGRYCRHRAVNPVPDGSPTVMGVSVTEHAARKLAGRPHARTATHQCGPK